MPLKQPAMRNPSSLIPDGCNTGVVFRSLLAVNGAVLLATLVAAPTLAAGVLRFIDAAILLELACLLSLLLLCALRMPLAQAPPWAQRLACVLLPGALTATLVVLLTRSSALMWALTSLSMAEGFLCGALAGGLLQHYFELRTRAFSPAIAEGRLQALQARIRPHFLFNSLNAVLALIRSDARRAESTLEDLAELFRVFMRDARDLVTLADEVRLCRQYLAIEQVRLGERLVVQWDRTEISDEVLQRARVPALLLQPLLENAVRYGVEPAQQPVTICIRLARSLDRIDITVVNPVATAAPAMAGNHMALDNIRERLTLLHDVEADLRTESRNGQFEVRLRFPYVKGP